MGSKGWGFLVCRCWCFHQSSKGKMVCGVQKVGSIFHKRTFNLKKIFVSLCRVFVFRISKPSRETKKRRFETDASYI